MRTIKFRAWDYYRKEMFFPSSINFSNGKIWVCDVHGEVRLEYELVRDKSHVMQFTGLHDRNGKEIYEGDIMKTDSRRPQEVFFKESQAQFCCRFPAGGASIDISSTWEVVGNIYENPELLKA